MAKLPTNYAWLERMTGRPRMIDEALKLYGTREFAGPANNPVIMSWAAELGGDVARDYRADSIPWCGLGMAICAKRAGKDLPASPLWALSWAKWGVAVPAPMLGDVVTFRRDGGGHVGLYVAEDSTALHVLGFNQGDQVSIVRMARTRLYAARRPVYQSQPKTVLPYRLAAAGQFSTNEA